LCRLQHSIVVTGLPKDGAPTTVNGQRSASFPAEQITDVVIDMASGDDHAAAVGLNVRGVLGMDGGDFGNDSIAVVASRLGRVGIRMGEGDDRLAVLGTTVAGDTVLTGEDGHDTLVLLANRFGSLEVRSFESRFPPA
jgi:hypothetical protein